MHKDEFYDLCSTLNIIRVLRPRIIRWVGHVARVGEGRGAYRVLTGNLETDHLQNVCVEESIILKMDLKEVGFGLGRAVECSASG